MKDKIVVSEIVAFHIMGDAGQVKGYNTTEPENIHAVANRLIELAERIKAERAVVAMQE